MSYNMPGGEHAIELQANNTLQIEWKHEAQRIVMRTLVGEHLAPGRLKENCYNNKRNVLQEIQKPAVYCMTFQKNTVQQMAKKYQYHLHRFPASLYQKHLQQSIRTHFQFH